MKLYLLLEPGRSIVGPAGVLLTRVLYRKTNNGKRFLIVDAAMNDLLRPSLYGAYHQIVAVKSPTASTDISDGFLPPSTTGNIFFLARTPPFGGERALLAIIHRSATA